MAHAGLLDLKWGSEALAIALSRNESLDDLDNLALLVKRQTADFLENQTNFAHGTALASRAVLTAD